MARWLRWIGRASDALTWVSIAAATIGLAVWAPAFLAYVLLLVLIVVALLRPRPFS